MPEGSGQSAELSVCADFSASLAEVSHPCREDPLGLRVPQTEQFARRPDSALLFVPRVPGTRRAAGEGGGGECRRPGDLALALTGATLPAGAFRVPPSGGLFLLATYPTPQARMEPASCPAASRRLRSALRYSPPLTFPGSPRRWALPRPPRSPRQWTAQLVCLVGDPVGDMVDPLPWGPTSACYRVAQHAGRSPSSAPGAEGFGCRSNLQPQQQEHGGKGSGLNSRVHHHQVLQPDCGCSSNLAWNPRATLGQAYHSGLCGCGFTRSTHFSQDQATHRTEEGMNMVKRREVKAPVPMSPLNPAAFKGSKGTPWGRSSSMVLPNTSQDDFQSNHMGRPECLIWAYSKPEQPDLLHSRPKC
ncbi:hypothetical protein TREES_T100009670 [Tupaia chinensis]|uniref:Uncharacterized protein n=1 Tax=Tupaia chinensis TaxID=246437 RepID=L9L790_TUPCH|nr:hypothetical protein TREES_T100009670 [Tupaia chinensis]